MSRNHLQTIVRKPCPLSVLLAGLAFLVNPYLACDDSEESFEYGEAEMQAAFTGTWSGALTYTDGRTTPVTLTLQEGGLAVQRSALCGSRTFLAEADACMASTTMGLVGTLATDDGAHDGQVEWSGSVMAIGAKLQYADLSLTQTGLLFQASWRDGALADIQLMTQPQTGDSQLVGTMTLTRK